MAKLSRIDRSACQSIRVELEELLELFGDDLGVVAGLENGGRYNDNMVTFKLQVRIADPQGTKNIEQIRFENESPRFGLKPTDFGKSFSFRGKKYVICGIKSSRWKYPIIARSSTNGRTYKFPLKTVKATIERD